MLNMELLVVITDRAYSEAFVWQYQEHGLPLTLAALGRGTAPKETLDMFSLETAEKAVLFSVASSARIRAAEQDLHKHLLIQNPGTGIVFTVPLCSIGGGSTAQFLAENQAIERKEYPMAEEEAFELILVIANEGYSKIVMDAAREKGGATGGTILHARGIGMEQAQKFFGISISDERELIFILCRARCRNRIMQAVIADAGQSSKARSIVFSVPVSSAAGLWILKERAAEE
jgi:hypothetical protein